MKHYSKLRHFTVRINRHTSATLTPDHVKIDDNGKKWLIKPRQKTGIPEIVPIFPPTLRVLNKYRDYSQLSTSKKLLPIPSNQKVNAYLKELAVFKRKLLLISPDILLHRQ